MCTLTVYVLYYAVVVSGISIVEYRCLQSPQTRYRMILTGFVQRRVSETVLFVDMHFLFRQWRGFSFAPQLARSVADAWAGFGLALRAFVAGMLLATYFAQGDRREAFPAVVALTKRH